MAKDPLAHARAQFAYHDAQAAKWGQYIKLHEELYGDASASLASPAPPAIPPAKPVRAAAPRGAIVVTRESAHLILDEAKGFVETLDLIRQIEDLGVEIGGADPRSTLSARLSGDAEIVSRRGQGYILKKYLEGAGYADRAASAPSETPNSADEDGREVAHDNMSH